MAHLQHAAPSTRGSGAATSGRRGGKQGLPCWMLARLAGLLRGGARSRDLPCGARSCDGCSATHRRHSCRPPPLRRRRPAAAATSSCTPCRGASSTRTSSWRHRGLLKSGAPSRRPHRLRRGSSSSPPQARLRSERAHSSIKRLMLQACTRTARRAWLRALRVRAVDPERQSQRAVSLSSTSSSSTSSSLRHPPRQGRPLPGMAKHAHKSTEYRSSWEGNGWRASVHRGCLENCPHNIVVQMC